MAKEVKTEIELEIGHVLFIDAVGYSKLLINEQRELLDELNRVVRNTDRFRAAEATGKLIRMPTGDGMALVFSDSPESPVVCALEISQALQNNPRLPLRMGIHSGPVSRLVDVNDRSNAAGAGINIAQRVMDCGDAGHILLSKRAADDLVEYRHWQPYLHEIGECEVKHGIKIELVNLCAGEVGNPELPSRCKERDRKSFGGESRTVRRRGVIITIALAAVTGVLLAIYGFFVAPLFRLPSQPDNVTPGSPISDKSIAVLPFENLSDEKENAYFTEGVQDEILTALAKVADLKVISRTSVMQYKSGVARNLREIGKALGVAHIVEGSVQRDHGRVRVNAQLIDARTDAHLWAEHYDRDLANVFAIQSELAEQIVSQLKAQLSPEEKAAIERQPTADLVAYDLYVRAKTLIANAVFNAPRTENLEQAVRLLNQAVARDPAFVLAYYQLAHAHDQLYLFGFDHTPTRLALASTAIESVQRLRPDSGEAHLALAKHLYWGYLDYGRARQELMAAQRTLPNDPITFLLAGYIDRRQGRWDESARNLEHAMELDPRNVFVLQQIARSYYYLRRYADMAATLDRALKLSPDDIPVRVQRAGVALDWHADAEPLHSAIQAIVTEDPKAAVRIADRWMELALQEHDSDSADRALAAMTADGCEDPFPRAWCEGVAARLRGDTPGARAAFGTARVEMEITVQAQPDYADGRSALGMIEAALGDKDIAIRESRRAVELLPVTKDSITGALMLQRLALVYAWTGEEDLALEQLAIVARIPSEVSYGQLRLHPFWDPLRGDPRFEKIVASLAPAVETAP